MTIILKKSLGFCFGEPVGDMNYWVERGRIPIGTLKPYEHEDYEYGIPENEIVSIPFDDVDLPLTSRRAFNVLVLGGSGDFKSGLTKNIWSILHDAGYYTGYIDPVGTESGRARKRWGLSSSRIAPHLKPKGIDLEHYFPSWAVSDDLKSLLWNFKVYSNRLKRMARSELWLGLGMSEQGANKTESLIKSYLKEKGNISMQELKEEWFNTFDSDEDRYERQTINASMRVLSNLSSKRVVDEEFHEDMFDEQDKRFEKKEPIKELNMLRDWKNGKAVVISFNDGSEVLMNVEVGFRITETVRHFKEGNRKPVVWFFDDAMQYGDVPDGSKISFSVHQISKIGTNYRKMGIGNVLLVQDLRFINEKMASTYKFKIISPLYSHPEGLSNINVPREAIDYLKGGLLVKDKNANPPQLEFLFVDDSNNVTPFFPFTPPCNHFEPVYKERRGEEI